MGNGQGGPGACYISFLGVALRPRLKETGPNTTGVVCRRRWLGIVVQVVGGARAPGALVGRDTNTSAFSITSHIIHTTIIPVFLPSLRLWHHHA